MGLDQFKELAAHMRHARRFPDATPLIEWIEPGVGGLQDAHLADAVADVPLDLRGRPPLEPNKDYVKIVNGQPGMIELFRRFD
jgi:hypothetical protein